MPLVVIRIAFELGYTLITPDDLANFYARCCIASRLRQS